MTHSAALGWYVHALLPATDEAGLPDGGLADGPEPCALIAERGVAAAVSLVELRVFTAAAGQVADPDWVAARAAAQHELARALHARGPCLPLGFGTVFGSETALRAWLAATADRARAGLAALAGRDEWVLRLTADATVLEAYVRATDQDVAQLTAAAASASPGAAFLLGKRLTRAVQAAMARTIAAAAAEIAADPAGRDAALTAEAPPHGVAHAWRMLLPRGATAEAVWGPARTCLAPRGVDLAATGPWPAYGHACAVLEVPHG